MEEITCEEHIKEHAQDAHAFISEFMKRFTTIPSNDVGNIVLIVIADITRSAMRDLAMVCTDQNRMVDGELIIKIIRDTLARYTLHLNSQLSENAKNIH